uniref:Uncharacterized protein n=1 Tax=Candidatus Kentrum sp. MB TaxID=2138164 RepID=A0A451BFJ0_9GAMM|nr:MAG: hypothetical protein BECKMB1821H_GA0114242_109311 [Candidatus Kentron sp. MB]
MHTIMNDTRIETIEQVRQFLSGASLVEFSISSKNESYKWIEQTFMRGLPSPRKMKDAIGG